MLSRELLLADVLLNTATPLLYLENHTVYKHQTFTVVLLKTCIFHGFLHPSPRKLLKVSTQKTLQNPLSD